MIKKQYEEEMKLWLEYFHTLMQIKVLLKDAITKQAEIKKIEDTEGSQCITTKT